MAAAREADVDVDLNLEDVNAAEQLWVDRGKAVFTDAKLMCAASTVVLAHRSVLCSASPVFRELLLEKPPPTSGALELPDFTEDQLLPFLEYIYKKSVIQFATPEMMIHGLYAADKYYFPSLTNILKSRLDGQLKHGNPEETLNTAVTILEMPKRLPESLENHFVPLASPITILRLGKLLRDGRLSFDVLDASLSAEDLEARPPEMDLFCVMNHWANAFCITKGLEPTGDNKRNALGSVADKIHFLDVPDDFISKEVFQSGLYSQEQLLKVYMRRHNPTVDVFFPVSVRNGRCMTREEIDEMAAKNSQRTGEAQSWQESVELFINSEIVPQCWQEPVDPKTLAKEKAKKKKVSKAARWKKTEKVEPSMEWYALVGEDNPYGNSDVRMQKFQKVKSLVDIAQMLGGYLQKEEARIYLATIERSPDEVENRISLVPRSCKLFEDIWSTDCGCETTHKVIAKEHPDSPSDTTCFLILHSADINTWELSQYTELNAPLMINWGDWYAFIGTVSGNRKNMVLNKQTIQHVELVKLPPMTQLWQLKKYLTGTVSNNFCLWLGTKQNHVENVQFSQVEDSCRLYNDIWSSADSCGDDCQKAHRVHKKVSPNMGARTRVTCVLVEYRLYSGDWMTSPNALILPVKMKN